MNSDDSRSDSSKVVDLKKFRDKKTLDDEMARGRNPLYVSHLRGKLSGSPHFKSPAEGENFGDRLQRIRMSLDKINRLMSELKKMSMGTVTDDVGRQKH